MPISVVMTVRNERRYIEESVGSVLRQTFADFELIVIDDGSSDGTGEMVAGLGRSDPRIRLIREAGRGRVPALNGAIALANHDLIAILDGDDLMVETRLERQFEFLQTHPEISLVGSWAHIIDTEGRVIGRSCPELEVDRGIRERQPRLFLRLINTSVTMRKSAVAAVGGFREGYFVGEDRDLWGRLVTAGYNIAVQPEFLAKYRRRPGSLSADARTMRRAHQVTDLIEANIIRRLDGKPELSAEEYRRENAGLPWHRRLNRARVTASRVCYAKAMNCYSKRRWLGCLTNLTAATALQPAIALRRLRSVLRGELY